MLSTKSLFVSVFRCIFKFLIDIVNQLFQLFNLHLLSFLYNSTASAGSIFL